MLLISSLCNDFRLLPLLSTANLHNLANSHAHENVKNKSYTPVSQTVTLIFKIPFASLQRFCTFALPKNK